MKYQLLKTWFLRILVLQLFLTLFAFLWTDYQIDHMWGEHTALVDHRQFQIEATPTAIVSVNTLSPDGSTMLEDQTVLIDQGAIQAIGKDIAVPDGFKLIDGKGKFLIPGLVDSHVHLWQSPNDLLLYLANGVTHVRELNGSEQHLEWREQIDNGRVGPNLYVASARINSNGLVKGWFDAWTAKIVSINTPSQAEKLLSKFESAQYDAVKIYTIMNDEDFFALDSASNSSAIPIMGHIPWTVELDDIWNSNLKELAHIEELVKALDREFGGFDAETREEFLNFVTQRSIQVSKNLKANNMSVITTLWLIESFERQRHDLANTLSSVELEYVNPGISELSPIADKVMGWLPDSNIYRISHEHSEEVMREDREYWLSYAEANRILLRAMLEQNVVVLAGTDANVPVAVPGFSIHDELLALNNAGMSTAQALKSATSAPKQWLNEKSGKIHEGYAADLILLNENPLLSIEHTKSIESVIKDGRVFDRSTLDAMLNEVKKVNDQSRRDSIDF